MKNAANKSLSIASPDIWEGRPPNMSWIAWQLMRLRFYLFKKKRKVLNTLSFLVFPFTKKGRKQHKILAHMRTVKEWNRIPDPQSKACVGSGVLPRGDENGAEVLMRCTKCLRPVTPILGPDPYRQHFAPCTWCSGKAHTNLLSQ